MPIYHQNPGDDGSEIVERRPYDSFAHGLLTYASVTLYCGLAVLEDDLRRLSEEHWVATRVSAADWAQRGNAYESLFRALPLPAEWADADHLRHPYKLEEALDELRIPDAGGLALVMTDFDAFARSGSRKVRTQARDILDTLIESCTPPAVRRQVAADHGADQRPGPPPRRTRQDIGRLEPPRVRHGRAGQGAALAPISRRGACEAPLEV